MNTKDFLLDKLIRIEISNYRRLGLLNNGRYDREPSGYFKEVRTIYSRLSKEEIEKLIKLKPKSDYFNKG